VSAVTAAVRPLHAHPVSRTFSYWWMRHRSRWVRTLAASVAAPTVYLLVMGQVLGTYVDGGGPSAALGGLRYVEFVGPAMVAASAMLLAVGDTSFPVFAAFRSERSYAAQFATPLRPVDILGGHLLWTLARVAAVAVLLTGVVVALGAAPSAEVVFVVPVAVLTGLVFAGWTAAFAAGQRHDGALLAIQRFVSTPMLLFAGVFFPVSQLPAPLRVVAQATPLWHGVDWSRDLANGRATIAGSLVHGLYLTVAAVAGLAVARRSYQRELVS
jgi:lipooligosaccharide transport system permease protein